MVFLKRALLALWVSFFLYGAALAGEGLSRPPGLEPEVGFWRRIFAECTTEQGLIHDNRYLGVVYEKIDLSDDANTARIQTVSDAARDKYQRILRTLGAGKRDDLSPEEQRVLALWPADVTSKELRDAVDRVRFQQGLANRFHDGLVRSGQWRDHIQRSLRSVGVPEELAALPHVESSFDPTARSFVGAAGLWQFTGDTGRRFMQIDQVVDERRDPYESSEAAARLLKYNYSVLNTWPLAITAYNHGLAGMRRAVDQMGTDDIEVIIRRYDGPAFGFASRNFYVSFLAALEIEQNPEKYFGTVQRKMPREDLVVELPDYMRVDTLEKAFGVQRATLQAYNPALLPPVWEGAKYVPRGFRLRLPAGGVIEAAPQTLAAIPASQRFSTQVPDKTHKVKSGDTLSRIAHLYGTNVAQLAQVNGIKPGGRIRVGQELKLPGRSGDAPAPVAVAQANPAPAPAPAATSTPPKPIAAVAAAAPPPPAPRAPTLAPTPVQTPSPAPAPKLAPATVAAKPAPKAAVVAADLPAVEKPGTPPAPAGDAGGTAPSLADPSDYLVADNDTVEVQAAETISHYAGWLDVTPDDLRKVNGWPRQRSLVLGQRVQLVFSNVSRETFLSRRVAYHHDLQEEYFTRYRITDTTEHKLRKGESVWVLAAQKYKVPVWLLRQYNPKLDLDQLRPGTRVIFPRVVRVA